MQQAKIIPTMVKIKSYRVSRRGSRGLIITLPKVWADDLGLGHGDRIDVYRDCLNRLTLIPQKIDLTPGRQMARAPDRHDGDQS